MTIKSRVKKLEETKNGEFKIIMPLLLDANGNRFPRNPAKDEVAAVKLSGVAGEPIIRRNPGEDYWNFNQRVSEEASKFFEMGIVGILGVEFL